MSSEKNQKITIIFDGEKNFYYLNYTGKPYKVEKGLTINEASTKILDEPIPTLCHHPYLPHGKHQCGICYVEDAKSGEFIRSCHEICQDGMEINTKSKRIAGNIVKSLKKKLSIHPLDCENCCVNGNCVFQNLLKKYNVTVESLSEDQKDSYMENYVEYLQNKKQTKYGNNAVVIDESKCIECYRCIRACNYVQGMSSMKPKITSDLEDVGEKTFVQFDTLKDYHSKMFR